MSGEFERIAWLRDTFRTTSSHVTLGIGDDSAEVDGVLLSVDTCVENVHFRAEFGSYRVIARRAFHAAMSDIAAMGGIPRGALVSLIAPSSMSDEIFRDIGHGIADASAELEAPVVGGNLSRGSEISITTTVIGAKGVNTLTRSGARIGDGIYVTGTVGGATLGLQAMLRQEQADHLAFVHRWQRPVARVHEGRAIASFATACIDISDGLLQDLGHVCDASGVGADVEISALPLLEGHHDHARNLGVDGFAAALTGGEDYELLFTAPSSTTVDVACTRIGVIVEARGVRAFDSSQKQVQFASYGHRHFE